MPDSAARWCVPVDAQCKSNQFEILKFDSRFPFFFFSFFFFRFVGVRIRFRTFGVERRIECAAALSVASRGGIQSGGEMRFAQSRSLSFYMDWLTVSLSRA